MFFFIVCFLRPLFFPTFIGLEVNGEQIGQVMQKMHQLCNPFRTQKHLV